MKYWLIVLIAFFVLFAGACYDQVEYEEETWVPDLQFGGAKVGITYVAGEVGGLYTRVGRMVTVVGKFRLSSKGISTGDATIAGLPYASDNNDPSYGSYAPVSLWLYRVTFADIPQAYIDNGEDYITLYEISKKGVFTAWNDTNFANDSLVLIHATYFR